MLTQEPSPVSVCVAIFRINQQIYSSLEITTAVAAATAANIFQLEEKVQTTTYVHFER